MDVLTWSSGYNIYPLHLNQEIQLDIGTRRGTITAEKFKPHSKLEHTNIKVG